MAYVSTFIPTDQKALQGTLDEYQKAYDIQTAKTQATQEAGDAIINTRAYDMAEKNKVMKEFSDVQAQLDKQFNFDRSSTEYADALSRRIGELKSKPIWALMSKKDELEKQRNSLKTQLGTNYYEKFDPNSVTLEQLNQDQSIFDKWVPHNLNDFYTRGAAAGKGLAEDINAQKIGHVTPWLLEFTNSTGQASTQAARNYLMNDEEGQIRLKDAISSAGGDPNDPKLQATVMDAMVANMVGKETKSRVIDEQWQLDNRPKTASTKEPKELGFDVVATVDTPGAAAFRVDKLEDFHKVREDEAKIDDEVDKIDQQITDAGDDEALVKDLEKKKSDLVLTKSGMDLEESKVVSLRNHIEYGTEQGRAANRAGQKLVKSYLPDLSDTQAEILNERIKNIFIDTNGAQRTGEVQQLTKFISNLGLLLPALGTAGQTAPYGVDYTPGQVAKLQKQIDELPTQRAANQPRIEAKNEAYQFNKILKEEIARAGAKTPDQIHTVAENLRKMLVEYRDYYKGLNAWVARDNYYNIEKAVDKKLAEGKNNQYQEIVPKIRFDDETKKDLVDFFSTHMDRLVVRAEKVGDEVSVKEQTKLQEKMKEPGTTFRMMTNGEDPVLISLIAKDGTRSTLEIDERRSGFDVLIDLAKTLPNTPEVLNQFYRGVDLPSSTPENRRLVSVTDDPTFTDQIKMYFTDKNEKVRMDKLKGLVVEKAQDIDGNFVYKVYDSKAEAEADPNKGKRYDPDAPADPNGPSIFLNKVHLLASLQKLQGKI